MGHAATMSAAAAEVEALVAEIAAAVPAHWTGRAAEAYQRSTQHASAALAVAAAGARGAAARIHVHEVELAAVRAALGAGGTAAV